MIKLTWKDAYSNISLEASLKSVSELLLKEFCFYVPAHSLVGIKNQRKSYGSALIMLSEEVLLTGLKIFFHIRRVHSHQCENNILNVMFV